ILTYFVVFFIERFLSPSLKQNRQFLYKQIFHLFCYYTTLFHRNLSLKRYPSAEIQICLTRSSINNIFLFFSLCNAITLINQILFFDHLFHLILIFLSILEDRKSTRLNSSHVSISYAV